MKDFLFGVPAPEKTRRQREIKTIPDKKLEQWEYDEAFMQALVGLPKVYFFTRRKRRGSFYYTLKESSSYRKDVTVKDIYCVFEHFTRLGWEVERSECFLDPVNSFEICGGKVQVLIIRGQK